MEDKGDGVAMNNEDDKHESEKRIILEKYVYIFLKKQKIKNKK